ncbi:hypothetical protein Ddye_016576 [Dipteronia dyeriana]|uniref:Uncharacterized protein n=1 Tax=Dipteronia dyeriana TaxID=168575 RepID=A0AAD9U753_9ROSI|nr:hypothetical protein Ddye_016576 [Dipteronia dyeriana]
MVDSSRNERRDSSHKKRPRRGQEKGKGVIEQNYNLGSPVLVRGKAVCIDSGDINMHLRTTLSNDTIAMFKGVPQLDIFTRMNIDLANSLVIRSMEFWNSRSKPIKQKNLLI